MKSIKSQLIEAPIEFHEKTQSTKTGSTFLICTQTITYIIKYTGNIIIKMTICFFSNVLCYVKPLNSTGYV